MPGALWHESLDHALYVKLNCLKPRQCEIVGIEHVLMITCKSCPTLK